tara:strand:+ start:544 stop:921 length:378 start_codon:yes stop_codon:yes gene_type:complete
MKEYESEQEKMLNLLNIGLGAFLLYLFCKNVGKKKFSGGGGFSNINELPPFPFILSIFAIITVIFGFFGVSLYFGTQGCNNFSWLLYLIISLSFAGLSVFFLKKELKEEEEDASGKDKIPTAKAV